MIPDRTDFPVEVRNLSAKSGNLLGGGLKHKITP